jgi:hypothetical protein
MKPRGADFRNNGVLTPRRYAEDKELARRWEDLLSFLLPRNSHKGLPNVLRQILASHSISGSFQAKPESPFCSATQKTFAAKMRKSVTCGR